MSHVFQPKFSKKITEPAEFLNTSTIAFYFKMLDNFQKKMEMKNYQDYSNFPKKELIT